ncbi:MAG: sensor histidine kinase [Nocardioides sp.]
MPHVPHVSVWVVAVVLAVPGVLQLPVISAAAPSGGLTFVVFLLLLQLPPLALVAGRFERRKARHQAVLREIRELESRVSNAESTVHEDEEKLHELKATIGGIASVHRLLRDRRSELPPSTRNRLERLHETELARLQRLLADRHAQPAEPLELSAVIGPYVDSLRSRGHRVSWEDTHAVGWGRPDDVAEIVNILLNNAVRHAPGAEIHLSTRTGASFVEVTVADDGLGVSAAIAPFVFERGTRSATSTGQGIGLDRARRLATAMGGDLALLPHEEARGATFVLRLPTGTSSIPTKDDRCLEHSD